MLNCVNTVGFSVCDCEYACITTTSATQYYYSVTLTGTFSPLNPIDYVNVPSFKSKMLL